MANSRTGAGDMHNKPRATHDTRTYKSVQRKTNYKKKKMAGVCQRNTKPTERAPNEQTWINLNKNK